MADLGSSLPLAGLRVVELGGSREAAFAGKLLVDFGARVLRVEASNGSDLLRRPGPFAQRMEGRDFENASLHLWLNAGKESLALDVGSAAGRLTLDPYLAESDVLLHGLPLRSARRRKLGPAAIARDHPHLLVAAMTAFGLSGPFADLAASEETVSAAAGISFGTGFPEREPLPPPPGLIAGITGLATGGAIVAALLGSERIGRGQYLDVASADILATLLTGYLLPQFIYRGVAGRRIGLKHNLGGGFPGGLWQASDGWVNLGVGISQTQYQRFLRMVGNPAWANEPRYRSRRVIAQQYAAEAAALVQPWFSERTREEVFAQFQEFRVPGGPVYRLRELVDHPFLKERGFFATVDHCAAGKVTQPRAPYLFDGERPPATGSASRLGSHQTWSDGSTTGGSPLPASRKVRARFTKDGVRPLDGVRVLDMTVSWAGPVATQLLADMGAEVIKVESRQRLDEMRAGRPILIDDEEGGDRGDWPDLQPLFHGLNRGKLSVTVNLKDQDGLAILYRLLPLCDLFVSNLGPGVLDKLGLDDDTLRRLSPDLIRVTAPAAGDEGIGRQILAYAPTTHALSGVTSVTGYPDGTICEIGGSWGDTVAALHIVYGALASLRRRKLGGSGCAIEVSQWEALASLLGEPLVEAGRTGCSAGPVGYERPGAAPNGAFRCAGDDAWIVVTVETDRQWRALAKAIGHPEWAKRGSKIGRTSPEAKAALADWAASQNLNDAACELQGACVPAMPVMNIGDIFTSDHFRARRALVEIVHPRIGIEWIYGLSYHLSATPARVTRPAPLLGEHNHQVFGDLMGLSESSIAALVEQGSLA